MCPRTRIGVASLGPSAGAPWSGALVSRFVSRHPPGDMRNTSKRHVAKWRAGGSSWAQIARRAVLIAGTTSNGSPWFGRVTWLAYAAFSFGVAARSLVDVPESATLGSLTLHHRRCRLCLLCRFLCTSRFSPEGLQATRRSSRRRGRVQDRRFPFLGTPSSNLEIIAQQ